MSCTIGEDITLQPIAPPHLRFLMISQWFCFVISLLCYSHLDMRSIFSQRIEIIKKMEFVRTGKNRETNITTK